MGIKGIYKEIGSGERVSLTKLAVKHLEDHGRPLRLAVDISIWQFQIQAARGGSNPAIRTLFYRLLRLLSLSIHPIFVFDGPNKPAFKRNKRSGRGDGVATAMAKRLIRLFGFQIHDAPGEAEAECALLEQHDIVDAVLSEDVDTIMFGCRKTLRNWSAEGAKGSKTPTHVSLYDAKEVEKGSSGLGREGMVLVALMSGGDYIPEGIPGAGVKLACEAARAGFGKTLCQLKRTDTSELNSWREWLNHELSTNESGFFRTRHKALNVPDSFPNMDVLRYYTHPVVSPLPTLDRLRSQKWGRPLDIQGLRDFVRETFDWNYRVGAVKFIRVLAPCLLVRRVLDRVDRPEQESEELDKIQASESKLVQSIASRREHWSTGNTPELRVSFIPTDIVGYDFQEEPDEVVNYGRDGLALNSDDDVDALEEGPEPEVKQGPKKPFNPTEPDLMWMSETVAKFGIPLAVEDWEATQRAKAERQKAKATKAQPKAKTKRANVASGSMDKFVQVTKNLGPPPKDDEVPQLADKQERPSREPKAPLASAQTSQNTRTTQLNASKGSKAADGMKAISRPATKAINTKPRPGANPWAIAGSQKSLKVTKPTGIISQNTEAIVISSSPVHSPTKSTHPPATESKGESNEIPDEPRAVDRNTTPLKRSPRKRRSASPSSGVQSGGDASDAPSPTPKSSRKPRKKLERTKSVPIDDKLSRPARVLTRVKTIAGDEPLEDSDSVVSRKDNENDDDDDDDIELPPISSLINKLSRAKGKSLGLSEPDHSPSVSKSLAEAASHGTPERKKEKVQTTLDGVLGGSAPAMTKLYVPRKSQNGFFKEVDVTVAEAEALKAHAAARPGRGSAWRRSDIPVIDLSNID